MAPFSSEESVAKSSSHQGAEMSVTMTCDRAARSTSSFAADLGRSRGRACSGRTFEASTRE